MSKASNATNDNDDTAKLPLVWIAERPYGVLEFSPNLHHARLLTQFGFTFEAPLSALSLTPSKK